MILVEETIAADNVVFGFVARQHTAVIVHVKGIPLD